jgi:hypothetical protein
MEKSRRQKLARSVWRMYFPSKVVFACIAMRFARLAKKLLVVVKAHHSTANSSQSIMVVS